MTNVDKKIASSDTTRASIGHGYFSNSAIHKGEQGHMNPDEVHRAGECGDVIGQLQVDFFGFVSWPPPARLDGGFDYDYGAATGEE